MDGGKGLKSRNFGSSESFKKLTDCRPADTVYDAGAGLRGRRRGFPRAVRKKTLEVVRNVAPAVALVVSLAGGDAFARGWTFDQALGAAASGYPSVLSKMSAREAAVSDLKSAQWQRFPTPSLETNVDRYGNNNFVFRIQQVLWTGGALTGSIEANRALRDAAEQGIREARFDVAARVIDAYVEALRQQARRNISVQNVKQYELLDDTIRRRVASEVSPEVDHRLTQARLAQATSDLTSVEQALERSLNALSELVGARVGETAPVQLAPYLVPGTREEALKEAIAVSPALSRLDFEESAAESEVKVKKAVFWPTLAVRYERSFNNNPTYFGTQSDDRIMAVIEAQPGAGLSALSGVQAARARKDSARQDREATLRDLKRLVVDAWNDREAARSQQKSAASARASAAEVAESYKRQYIIGRKSWLDVMNAVREASQSELALADADAQFNAATLRIALLTDKLELEGKKHGLLADTRH